MAARFTSQVRIGISGWTYAPWRGVFYPRGWPQTKELAYASRRLNSIEINGTFYSLQRPAAKSRDVFCYFDNDVKVKAPFDAMALARRAGVFVDDRDGAEIEAPKLSSKALAQRVRSHWPGPEPGPKPSASRNK